ncbi:MAG: hypothetical protein JNK64_03630 [Myxococcales bacterium]|nr:hypothetical protein [Myxococcales bacterium]
MQLLRWFVALGLLATATATTAPARADTTDDAIAVERIAISTFNSVRRAIAVGPHVGGFGGMNLDADAGVSGVTFGLGLNSFAVPSAFDLREQIKAAVKEKVKERIAEIVANGGTPPDDLSDLIREVATEIRERILKQLAPRHTIEHPQFGLMIEAAILTSTGGGFQTRLIASKGIKSVSVGLAVGVQRAGGTTRFLPGLELDLRLTPFGQQRTPVFALYARGDLAVGNGDPALTILGGGRVLLDVF